MASVMAVGAPHVATGPEPRAGSNGWVPLPRGICSFYKKGTCLRINCQYFHGAQSQLDELRLKAKTMESCETPGAHVEILYRVNDGAVCFKTAKAKPETESKVAVTNSPFSGSDSYVNDATRAFSGSGSLLLTLPLNESHNVVTAQRDAMGNSEVSTMSIADGVLEFSGWQQSTHSPFNLFRRGYTPLSSISPMSPLDRCNNSDGPLAFRSENGEIGMPLKPPRSESQAAAAHGDNVVSLGEPLQQSPTAAPQHLSIKAAMPLDAASIQTEASPLQSPPPLTGWVPSLTLEPHSVSATATPLSTSNRASSEPVEQQVPVRLNSHLRHGNGSKGGKRDSESDGEPHVAPALSLDSSPMRKAQAHSVPSNSRILSSAPTKPAANSPQALRTVACLSFLSGNCDRENCRFVHLRDEIRLLPAHVCAYYTGTTTGDHTGTLPTTGGCSKGNRCRYFHGTSESLRLMREAGVLLYNPLTTEPYQTIPDQLESDNARAKRAKWTADSHERSRHTQISGTSDLHSVKHPPQASSSWTVAPTVAGGHPIHLTAYSPLCFVPPASGMAATVAAAPPALSVPDQFKWHAAHNSNGREADGSGVSGVQAETGAVGATLSSGPYAGFTQAAQPTLQTPTLGLLPPSMILPLSYAVSSTTAFKSSGSTPESGIGGLSGIKVGDRGIPSVNASVAPPSDLPQAARLWPLLGEVVTPADYRSNLGEPSAGHNPQSSFMPPPSGGQSRQSGAWPSPPSPSWMSQHVGGATPVQTDSAATSASGTSYSSASHGPPRFPSPPQPPQQHSAYLQLGHVVQPAEGSCRCGPLVLPQSSAGASSHLLSLVTGLDPLSGFQLGGTSPQGVFALLGYGQHGGPNEYTSTASSNDYFTSTSTQASGTTVVQYPVAAFSGGDSSTPPMLFVVCPPVQPGQPQPLPTFTIPQINVGHTQEPLWGLQFGAGPTSLHGVQPSMHFP